MVATAELLRGVYIFRDLPDVDLDEVARRLVPRAVQKDEVIVAQQQPGDSLYLIANGKVKVSLSGEKGREIILSVLGPGEFFGEMSLLDGEPRSASVIAQSPAELYILSREAFVDYLRRSPRTALNILAEMSRRLRRADEIIGNLALLDVYGRVAHILLEMAKKEGIQREDGILIDNRPTQQELAAMLGTSRETVSRALNDFARRGYLSMSGRRILLRRSFALEAAYPK
jgi:CRP/FNR family cyclic AMP-dependent transcriptional regulator